MSVPTPVPGDLVPYQPQTWVDVPIGTPAPEGAVREDAAAFNRIEGGLGRAHKVAVAAWTLLQAVQELVATLPTDTDLAGYATLTSLSSAVADLHTEIQGRATPAQVDARVQQVVGAAPAALDTLVEIAAQLASDESAASALTGRVTTAEQSISANSTAIAAKYTKPGAGIPLSDLAAAVLSYFATPAQVDARVQQVVGAAPAALDTLVEIAAQLASDESAASALTGRVTTAEQSISSNSTAIAANAAAILLRYLKPSGGIPAADLDPAVLAGYLTRSDASATYGQKAAVDANTAAVAGFPSTYGQGVANGKSALALAIPDSAPRSLYSTQNPAAEYDPVTGRTFLAYLGGYRRLYVTYYDHAAAQWADPTYVAPSYIANTDDDHGAPSLAIDQKNRRVVVFFGTHGEPQAVARSGADCDVTTWSVQRLSVGGTYASLCYDPTSQALYAALRSGGTHGSSYPAHEFGTIVRSTDGGANWTDLGASGGIVLTKAAFPSDSATDYYGTDCDARDGRVYLSWAIAHGSGHDGPRYGAYVAYYNTADGLMYTVDGTSLGARIDSASKFTSCLVPGTAQDFVYPIKTALAPDGKVLTAFNLYDSALDLVKVTAALHTGVAGSAWTVTDTGVRSNFLYHGVAPAWRDGRWELACVRLLGGDRTVAQTAQADILSGASAGGDMVVLTSANGTAWASDSVFSREAFPGGGCMYLQNVRNAHADLTMLAQSIAVGAVKSAAGGSPESGDQAFYNTPTWESPIYAVHARTVLPRLTGRTRRPEVLLRINPWYLAVNDVQAGTSWATVDLSALVPRGTKSVVLQVNAVGTGTSGACVLSFREASTSRSSDAQISTRGEWTDAMVYDIEVPLSPDRWFQWKATTTNVRLTMRPRALRVGTQARAIGAPTALPPVTPFAFSDDFNRAEATTTGNGWVSSHGGLSPAITFPISSQAVGISASGTATAYDVAPGTATTADQFAQMQVTARPTSAAPDASAVVRYANTAADGQGGNPDAYYGRYNANAGAWQLYKTTGGTATLLGSLTEAAPSLPYTVRVEAQGSTIRLLGNGTQKVSATDTTLTAGRRVGFNMRWTASGDAAQRVDNFTGGDL